MHAILMDEDYCDVMLCQLNLKAISCMTDKAEVKVSDIFGLPYLTRVSRT